MKLPSNCDDLRTRWASGEDFEFYLFYGHKPPDSGVDASCLSQWFARAFRIDGVQYPTAEHWMMAEKARLFGDDEMLREILSCKEPKDAKAFGRNVSGFDSKTWGKHKIEIVKRGNLAKFGQHLDLRQFLLSTGDYKSASTFDRNSGRVAERGPDYSIGDRLSEPLHDDTFDQAEVYNSVSANSVGTSNVILVEAAGRDTIWGIGLGVNNPKSRDPLQWRGQNLLGFALTAVREEIASDV